ncbi:von Willebrand factor type A [Ktedonobacter racemifer DSM 44963]|uniref:von Willebrand factor type A n=1 Tax=Ktedonobacter racemifer DSM 44963 TaxID=485913 RepID=D6TQT6_KTERA|nr:von Willebrand factor type A [Ktedonobacter racemifer DSM 44963]
MPEAFPHTPFPEASKAPRVNLKSQEVHQGNKWEGSHKYGTETFR